MDYQRRWRYGLLGVVICICVLCLNPNLQPQPATAQTTAQTSQLSQGQALYEAGRLTEARQLLENELQQARAQNDPLNEAIVLSNLALVSGQMGDWSTANESISQALNEDFAAQQSHANAPFAQNSQAAVLAQILNVQGRLLLAQGRADAAFTTWEKAAQRYQQIGDRTNHIRTQLRQARALQALGFHRRAIHDILEPLRASLESAESTPEKALGLQELSEAYQTAESLEKARQTAAEALAIAQESQSSAAISSASLRMGNVETVLAAEYRSRQQTSEADATTDTAITFYQQAINQDANQGNKSVSNSLRASLNQLSALVDAERVNKANQLWPVIAQQINQLSPHRDSIYAHINLADSLMHLTRFRADDAPLNMARQLLEKAQTQAETLSDNRAQAHVLGYLGQSYQMLDKLQAAETYTSRAVLLAQQVNAPDLSYRWYAQLGEILEAQGDQPGAIAAYSGAVNALKQLRSDLVNISPEIRFSFQKSVNPIHRRLINLLLALKAGNPSQQNLLRARDAIESLREAELVNFLRAACLDGQVTQQTYAVEGTETTAFIHTLILRDRLELIVKLPGEQSLRNYTQLITESELDQLAATLRERISTTYYSNSGAFKRPAEQLYQSLFSAAPKQGGPSLSQDLATHSTQTLAFVLDSSLRNVPISALYDSASQDFVLNQYQISITPGFQLLNAYPGQRRRLSALTFGLTEARQGFEALPSVKQEVEGMCDSVSCNTQFDEAFTQTQFLQRASQGSAPIVHLATHGQFGAQLDSTFVLTWDDSLSISDFNQWLQSDERSLAATELLVLSACETAVSDDRTALGLAGVAVRAGARSTLASLWRVDDRMTALMMPKFYEALAQQGTTKGKALQIAKQYIIEQYPEYKHPFYWSAFVLVGNWL